MNKEFNSCYLPSFLTEVLHNFALNFYKLRGYQDRCENIVPLTVKSYLLQKIKDYFLSKLNSFCSHYGFLYLFYSPLVPIYKPHVVRINPYILPPDLSLKIRNKISRL